MDDELVRTKVDLSSNSNKTVKHSSYALIIFIILLLTVVGLIYFYFYNNKPSTIKDLKNEIDQQ